MTTTSILAAGGPRGSAPSRPSTADLRNVTEWVDQHLLCDMARWLAPSDDTWVRAWTTRDGGVEPSWRRRGYFTSAGPSWNQHAYTIRKSHCDSWRR